uniref:MAPK regulated corepressor interacting protein 2 n=1 Tax=Suricata suricatta TaxID=37032 RepID=A0A673TMW9_SURSU
QPGFVTGLRSGVVSWDWALSPGGLHNAGESVRTELSGGTLARRPKSTAWREQALGARSVESTENLAFLSGPSQQQVESRLGELLKCRQAAPPTPPPPRAQPPGPWPLSSPGPRLVFNRVNGRRPPATSPSLEGTQETYTLAHEENVRFVSEAWQQVEQQLGGGPAGESGPRPVQYMEKTPNPRLQNFVPIDLDEWWAQQFLARITNCS